MRLSSRPIGIVALTLALLWGACGNVAAAAFCPRFSNRACCPKHAKQATNSSSDATSNHTHHHEEAESSSEMSSCAEHENSSEVFPTDEPTTNGSAEADEQGAFVGSLLESGICIHCLNHSQPAQQRFSIANNEASTNTAATASEIVKLPLALPSLAKLLPSYDHGPPGQAQPIFILNNVFRI